MKKTFLHKLVLALAFTFSFLLIVMAFKTDSAEAKQKKTVRVSTEEELNKAVKDSDVGTIIFRTQAYISITIKENKKAASKFLIVDAPNAVITNNAVFSYIYILKADGFLEKASGNSYELSTAQRIDFVIGKNATVNKLTFVNMDEISFTDYSIAKGGKLKELCFAANGVDMPVYSEFNSKKRTVCFRYKSGFGREMVVEYKVDKSGRIISKYCDDSDFGCDYSYEYDSKGNLLRVISRSGKDEIITEYTYDSEARLISEKRTIDTDVSETRYEYDKKGNRIKTEYFDNGTVTDYSAATYDKYGKMLTYEYAYPGSKTTYTYKYDKNGFLVSLKYIQSKKSQSDSASTTTYKYNKAGDLIKSVCEYDGGKYEETFKYDKYGNAVE